MKKARLAQTDFIGMPSATGMKTKARSLAIVRERAQRYVNMKRAKSRNPFKEVQ